MGRTKERRVDFWGLGLWEHTYVWETNGREIRLSQQHLAVLVPLSADFGLLHGHKNSLGEGEGIYGSPRFLRLSAFSQIREAPGRVLSASVESQMPRTQDNTYAKVSYFGVACSARHLKVYSVVTCTGFQLDFFVCFVLCFHSKHEQTLKNFCSFCLRWLPVPLSLTSVGQSACG